MRSRVGTSRRTLRRWTLLAAIAALALPAPAAAAAEPAYITQWGSLGSGADQLNAPAGADTDSHDNVYVADFGNDRVQKFGSDGELLASWSSFAGNGQLLKPTGVAVDPSGNVYVADNGNQRVVKLDSSGSFLAQLGCAAPTIQCPTGAGDGQFLSPTGVATDSAGNLYVADQGNDRVQRFTSGGAFDWSFGGSASFDPSGVDVSSGGILYVTNAGSASVERWDVAGASPALVDSFDGSSTSPANTAFENPVDVAVSDAGQVFVADYNANSVERFSATGAYEARWDTAGSGNGQFASPFGVATGSLDTFYVSDSDNNRVQKFGVPIDGTAVRISGTRLVVEATTGISNDLAIARSGSTFTVTDTGDDVFGGGGCPVVGSTATCTSTALASIRVTTDDMDDVVSVTGPAPATLEGGTGADDLTGGAADDTLIGGAGADTLAGAGGTDTVSYTGTGTGVVASLAAGTGSGGDSIASDVENLTGGSGDDTLEGDEFANVLTGGAGTDTVTYAGSASGVVANLETGIVTGGAGGDTIAADVENLTGSASADTLTGDAGVNAIAGGDGNDDIQIRDSSADSASCGSGADTVTADASDTATPDCETVLRPSSGGGGGGTGGGGTGGGGGAGAGPTAPGAAPAPSAPRLSSLRVPRMRRGRVARLSYSLDRAAAVTITIERAQKGRKVRRACRRQTRRNRRKRRCTLFRRSGRLTQAGHAGRNMLRFSGKLGRRALKPGRYRASAVATSAAGRSSPARANFKVRR